MAVTWKNDGLPMEDGRLCMVITSDEGFHPQYIYGATRDEILEKLANTSVHAQSAIARLKSGAAPAATAPAAAKQAGPRKLTADETMAATADLGNPAKAAAAAVRMVESATGLDLTEMGRRALVERISTIQGNWAKGHPEFPHHPTNYKLVSDAAALRVGYANITAEVCEQVYQELAAGDLLVDAAPKSAVSPALPPEEIPAAGSAGTTRGATSYRRTALRGAAAPVAQPRYTAEEIDKMPADAYRRKYESDPAFKAFVDAPAQPRRA